MADAPASTGAAEPRRILDRYRLEERLGVGGTAEVWRAEDELLGRMVAVKLLHTHLLPDASSRARVEAEARSAAALTHPGIVGVYDIAMSENEAAIVLEYVAGEPLNDLLARQGRLAERVAAAIGRQVAEALEHAHERGIVHRDVKPANILVSPDGRARLVDFGIARTLEENAERLTLTGAVVGTLRYMAPEQLDGEPADRQTDVFGLGATLYEMLAGRPPFEASGVVVLLEQHRHRPAMITGVPGPLMGVVIDALEPDRRYRTATAAEMAARLAESLGEKAAPQFDRDVRPGAARVASGAAGPPPLAAGPSRATPDDQPRRFPLWEVAANRRAAPGIRLPRRAGVAAAGLAGLAILAVVAANLLGGASGSPGGSNDGNEGTGGAGGSGDGETRTMAASQDARVAVSGDYRAGAGADSTLPVGAARGRNGVFLYRSLIQFEDDWIGTTRIQRIQLRLTRSGAVRASRGSSPSTRVMRNTAGRWSEGGGAELSSSNEVTWVNKPETTAEGSVTFEGPTKSGEEVLVDITDLYLPLAPEELGGQAVDNFGITLLAASDDGSPDGDGSVDGDQTNEFQSSDSRNGAPELVVTYEPE